METFGRHLSRGKLELYRSLGLDVVLGAREGITLADAYSDRRWIDCHCNGGVFNLGHRHPRVIAAMRDALDHLDIGNHHLISEYRTRLAQRLAASTGRSLPRVVFGVSGGEAMDLAIKAARGSTGRSTIISAVGGYHGHTGLALAAGDAQYRDPFGPNPPGYVQVPFDDLPALEHALDDTTAAVVLEPIPATLGMPIARPGYFSGVETLCRDRGAKLILDEVQTGLGRTGRIWCYQHDDLSPDALVTGKALSGGIYPITATLFTDDMYRVLDANPFAHISTFGGAELGCVVAQAVLDCVEAPGLLDRVAALSDRLASAFAGLPFELRRRGLMMGFKFATEGGGMRAAQLLFKAGVFAAWANNDTSVLQFLPPLVLTDDEADDLAGRVCAALA
jgi:acetylornithine/succinyldiaminopimelate/putrescine aminotransferase